MNLAPLVVDSLEEFMSFKKAGLVGYFYLFSHLVFPPMQSKEYSSLSLESIFLESKLNYVFDRTRRYVAPFPVASRAAPVKTVSDPYSTFAPERRMMSAHFALSARTNSAN